MSQRLCVRELETPPHDRIRILVGDLVDRLIKDFEIVIELLDVDNIRIPREVEL